MTFSYQLSTEHNTHENLIVWDRLQNGSPAGWRVNAADGYVFYDPTETYEPQIDPMTGEETPAEIYYAKVRYLPRNYNWDNFALVAVEETGGDS